MRRLLLYEAAMGRDRRDFPDLPLGWPDVPEREALLELNAILLKACAADARQRYQSADQMRADLELLHGGRSVKRRQAWQKSRRLAGRFAAAASFVALAIVVPRFFHEEFPHVLRGLSPREVARTLGVNTARVYLAKHRLGPLVKRAVKEIEDQLV